MGCWILVILEDRFLIVVCFISILQSLGVVERCRRFSNDIAVLFRCQWSLFTSICVAPSRIWLSLGGFHELFDDSSRLSSAFPTSQHPKAVVSATKGTPRTEAEIMDNESTSSNAQPADGAAANTSGCAIGSTAAATGLGAAAAACENGLCTAGA